MRVLHLFRCNNNGILTSLIKEYVLAHPEVENVMKVDILIVVNPIQSQSLKGVVCCCDIFKQHNSYPRAVHLSLSDIKKERINQSGNRPITIMQIYNAGFIAQIGTDVFILILLTMNV